MKIDLVRLLIGYTRFTLSAAPRDAGRILFLLRERKLCDIVSSCGTLSFTCFRKDAASVERLLTEKKIPHSVRAFGVFSQLKRLSSRRGIAAGLLLSLLLHSYLLNHIFSIRVTGNETIPTEDVLETLSTLGFYEGCSLSDVHVDELYLRYLVREKRAAWMHINRLGVTAQVEIAEATAAPKALPDKISVCNIVAKCDGIVRRADVYSGGCEVSAGQSVVKGQLLVSSFFETRLSGTLLRRARGTVLADTEPVFEMYIPKAYKKAEKTDAVFRRTLLFLNRRLTLRFAFLPDGTDNREKTRYTPTLFSRLALPFSIEEETFFAPHLTDRERSLAEARALYQKKLAEFKKCREKSGEILFEETTEREEADAYVFKTRFLCRESIGIERNAGMEEQEIAKAT